MRVIVWERLANGAVRETRLEIPEHPGCAGSVAFAWGVEWQAHFAGETNFAESERRLMLWRAAQEKPRDR